MLIQKKKEVIKNQIEVCIFYQSIIYLSIFYIRKRQTKSTGKTTVRTIKTTTRITTTNTTKR